MSDTNGVDWASQTMQSALSRASAPPPTMATGQQPLAPTQAPTPDDPVAWASQTMQSALAGNPQSTAQPSKKKSTWANIGAGLTEAGASVLSSGYGAAQTDLSAAGAVLPPDLGQASEEDVYKAGEKLLTGLGMTDPNKVEAPGPLQEIARGIGRALPGVPLAAIGPGGLGAAASRLGAMGLGSLGGTIASWTGIPGAEFVGNLIGSGLWAGPEAALRGGGSAAQRLVTGSLGLGEKEAIPLPGGGSFAGATAEQANRVGRRLAEVGEMPTSTMAPYPGQPTTAEMSVQQRAPLATQQTLATGEAEARRTNPVLFNDEEQGREKVAALKNIAPANVNLGPLPNLFKQQQGQALQDVEQATASLARPQTESQLGSTVRTGLTGAKAAEKATVSAPYTAMSGGSVNTTPMWGAAQSIVRWMADNQRYLAGNPELQTAYNSKVLPLVKSILGSDAVKAGGYEFPEAAEASGLAAPIPERIPAEQGRLLFSSISSAKRAVPADSVVGRQLASIKQSLQGEMEKAIPGFTQISTDYAAYKTRWSTGALGKAIARDRGQAGPFTTDDSRVLDLFDTPTKFRQLLNVLGNNPDAIDATRSYLLKGLQGIIGPDGQVDAGKFRAWRQSNNEFLQNFPELGQSFDRVENAQAAYDSTLSELRTRGEAFANRIAGNMIADDPQSAVVTAMTGRDGPQRLDALRQQIQAARGLPDDAKRAALTELQRRVSDNIIDKFGKEWTVDSAGNVSATGVKGNPFNQFLSQYRVPLKKLYGDPTTSTGGGQAFNDLFVVGRAINNRLKVNQLMRNAPQASAEGAHGFGLGSLAGTIGIEHLGQSVGGIPGMGLAAVIGKTAIDKLRVAGVQDEKQLFALAMRHPEVARALVNRGDVRNPPSSIWLKQFTASMHDAVLNDIARQTATVNQ